LGGDRFLAQGEDFYCINENGYWEKSTYLLTKFINEEVYIYLNETICRIHGELTTKLTY